MNRAVVLLSGGLDSLVSLDIAQKEVQIDLALTFNYGQKAYLDEAKAAKEISKIYNIEHKIIELPFLAEITNNALTNKTNSNFNDFREVWVPNRNGLFLNIAACFCDKFNYDTVIFGANKEEATDFPDNSEEFIKVSNNFFEYSTLNKLKVFAPCLQLDKLQIINYAINNNLALNLVKSCYNSSENTNKKNCGECMSCKLLYNAIKKANRDDLIKEIF